MLFPPPLPQQQDGQGYMSVPHGILGRCLVLLGKAPTQEGCPPLESRMPSPRGAPHRKQCLWGLGEAERGLARVTGRHHRSSSDFLPTRIGDPGFVNKPPPHGNGGPQGPGWPLPTLCESQTDLGLCWDSFLANDCSAARLPIHSSLPPKQTQTKEWSQSPPSPLTVTTMSNNNSGS